MRQPHLYYLAGSFAERNRLRDLRTEINTACPHWSCCATWLDLEPATTPELPLVALLDAHDVLRADALVFVRGAPHSPGKHTELGLAIAAAIPIHILTPHWTKHTASEPCIFLALLDTAQDTATWLATGAFGDGTASHQRAAEIRNAIATGPAPAR